MIGHREIVLGGTAAAALANRVFGTLSIAIAFSSRRTVQGCD